jgi:poly-gamma-glutamate synthesis protein (capsule biosynthesis protein)
VKPEDRLEAPLPAPAGVGTSGVTLFVCGDLMIGRGIDQILPHPGSDRLYEACMTSARGYVELAEHASGPVPAPVASDYIWGDALAEIERMHPDLRIANLETAVTARGTPWPNKGIHYRAHPANLGVLAAASIDACSLANNHVLDWGEAGLRDTLQSLAAAGISVAGAGHDAGEAAAPAVLDLPGGRRVLLVGYCTESAGVPRRWAATANRAGVNLLPDLSPRTMDREARRLAALRAHGDLVVASIHWGGNWGYSIPDAHRAFARGLIDAGVDVIHGHSSHHPLPVEVYRDRLILYGCGDLINDYEGIGGYEAFRPELSLLYFPSLDASGSLRSLRLAPMRMRRLRLERAGEDDVQWLAQQLDAAGAHLGTRIERGKDALWIGCRGCIRSVWTRT